MLCNLARVSKPLRLIGGGVSEKCFVVYKPCGLAPFSRSQIAAAQLAREPLHLVDHAASSGLSSDVEDSLLNRIIDNFPKQLHPFLPMSGECIRHEASMALTRGAAVVLTSTRDVAFFLNCVEFGAVRWMYSVLCHVPRCIKGDGGDVAAASVDAVLNATKENPILARHIAKKLKSAPQPAGDAVPGCIARHPYAVKGGGFFAGSRLRPSGSVDMFLGPQSNHLSQEAARHIRLSRLFMSPSTACTNEECLCGAAKEANSSFWTTTQQLTPCLSNEALNTRRVFFEFRLLSANYSSGVAHYEVSTQRATEMDVCSAFAANGLPVVCDPAHDRAVWKELQNLQQESNKEKRKAMPADQAYALLIANNIQHVGYGVACTSIRFPKPTSKNHATLSQLAFLARNETRGSMSRDTSSSFDCCAAEAGPPTSFASFVDGNGPAMRVEEICTLSCWQCWETGHAAKDCPKRIAGEPPVQPSDAVMHVREASIVGGTLQRQLVASTYQPTAQQLLESLQQKQSLECNNERPTYALQVPRQRDNPVVPAMHRQLRCSYCGQKHHVSDCPKLQGATVPSAVEKMALTDKSLLFCISCGEYGHSYRTCSKISKVTQLTVKGCPLCGSRTHVILDCPVRSRPPEGYSEVGMKLSGGLTPTSSAKSRKRPLFFEVLE